MTCNCDVPRNANGWPTVEPKHFNLRQLIAEAKKWRGTMHDGNTVGASEWEKYATELYNRLYISKVQLEAGMLPEKGNEPYFLKNGELPKWWGQL